MKTYWLVMGTRVSSVIKSSIRVLVTDEDMLFIEPALQRLIKRNPTFGITMIERKDEESSKKQAHRWPQSKHIPRRGQGR